MHIRQIDYSDADCAAGTGSAARDAHLWHVETAKPGIFCCGPVRA